MYGNENVVASDIRKAPNELMENGPFIYADVMNYPMLERIVVDWRIGRFTIVIIRLVPQLPLLFFFFRMGASL